MKLAPSSGIVQAEPKEAVRGKEVSAEEKEDINSLKQFLKIRP